MAAPLDCPGTEGWQALLDAALTPEQWEPYERHLESCPACQSCLDRAGADGDGLRRLGQEVGDPTRLSDEPALAHALERLRECVGSTGPAPAELADLYFLRPSDRPGVLGTLGGYEVLEVIGQGGMGVVLKAFEPALNRFVAIKVMAAAVAGSATARLRFTREAKAAAAVSHDHVVAVHGVSEADGLPYLVMQYVAGESLQDQLDRKGPLEVTEAVRIGHQTAAGLAAAHAQGLIHRDIKPANLLLENGVARVKITDFGLARMTCDAGLTQAGVVSGTPEYMAPEQARGEAVDHRADLFSLGSVLYACCTGEPPFRGSEPLAVLRRVNDETPAPVRSRNPDVPAWLEELIAGLMAKGPAERFQSAAEVAALLEGYLAHLRQPATVPVPPLPSAPAGGRARPAWRARSRRFWQSAWPAALLFLAFLGVFGWLVAQGPLPPLARPARPGVFSQDFSGHYPVAPLELFGADAASLCRSEDGGFRITLPADRPTLEPVGLLLASRGSGDFEITAGYELLQVGTPPDGSMSGLEMYVMTATPTQEAVGFYRVVMGGAGDVFQCTRMTYADGKRRYKSSVAPAASKAGRLRLTRTGSEVTFWAADGPAADFRELCRYDLGRDDLRMVRLAAYARTPDPVDLRLTDLKVRAEELDGADPDAVTAGGASVARSKGWLVAAAIIGSLTGAAFLGAWLLTRRRRAGKAPDQEPAPAPVADTVDQPAAAAPPLVFTCPGCGHGLKVKAELAGKKGKCPKCGGVVLVPAPIQATRPGGAPS